MGGPSYRKLIEESSDIIATIGVDGAVTYASPAVRHILGYDPEELIGEIGYEYQHPDDRETLADAIGSIRAEPGERQVIETRVRQTDGSRCWIGATLRNRLDDPDIDWILVRGRDLSGRNGPKGGPGRYQALADEYETLLRTVEDAIFFVAVEPADAEHVFRFERLSRSYEAQTGITTEDVRGESPTDVFGDELGTEPRENCRRCVAAREPITYQEEIPVETGARFWQTNLAPVITDGDVTRITGITRNVTEQVKRERQLHGQNERLDEFASVVSHDIRNPLNVAQARAELLAEECESEHLVPIVRSLDRMEEAISDTLTLARQGQVVTEKSPIASVNLVGACWKPVSTAEASIEIEDEVTISGDWGRLQHVFENPFETQSSTVGWT